MSVPIPGEVLAFCSVDAARAVAHYAMSRLNMVVDGFETTPHPLDDHELESVQRILMARVRLKAILDDYETILEGLA